MAQHLVAQHILFYLLEWALINYKMIKLWKIVSYYYTMLYQIYQAQI
jgi:hypothetical protein